MIKIPKFKPILVYLGFLIVCFIIFECGIRTIFHVRYTSPEVTRDKRQDLSVYENTKWGKEYFQELKASEGYTYESYLTWRGRPFEGKYINISSEGIRKTWNPQNADRSKAKLVYCFGGSTLWGFGARDDYTIPSYISKFLNKNKGEERYYVINYANKGYNFFQEVIYLLLLLKDHQIPDYVVFFDGINDIHAAYLNNEAGGTQDLTLKREQLKNDIEIRSNRDYLKKFVKGYIDTRINAFSFTRRLRNKWRKWRALDDEETVKRTTISDRDEQELLELANDVADNYFSVTDIVRGLSDVYGFKVAFFWQPGVGINMPSSEEEVRFASEFASQRKELSRLTYKIVDEKKNQKDFYDLQEVFSLKDKDKTVFIDCCHLSEAGNSIVAEQIVSILKLKNDEIGKATKVNALLMEGLN